MIIKDDLVGDCKEEEFGMSKFVSIKNIPSDEYVVLDVPAGHLRIGGVVNPNGEGVVTFSISDEAKQAGTRQEKGADDRTAMKVIVQSPEKAEAIALAFIEMARKMREVHSKHRAVIIVNEEDPGCGSGCEGCPYECGSGDE